jgi:hypothetical protein
VGSSLEKSKECDTTRNATTKLDTYNKIPKEKQKINK